MELERNILLISGERSPAEGSLDCRSAWHSIGRVGIELVVELGG